MNFDFEKNMTVDTLDSVPDQFKPLYIETEGKYHIDRTDQRIKSAVEAILGFNKALKASRNEADTLRKKSVDLSLLSEYGDTPEVIKSSIESKIAEISKDPKVDIEKIKAEISKGFIADKETLTKKNEGLQNQLYNVLVENTAITAINELKGIPELIMPFVKSQVTAKTEDGKFKVIVVDADNNTRYSTVTGEPMTVKEFITEMKSSEKFGRLFESETRSGAGMKPPNNKPGQGPITSTQKIALGLTKTGNFSG